MDAEEAGHLDTTWEIGWVEEQETEACSPRGVLAHSAHLLGTAGRPRQASEWGSSASHRPGTTAPPARPPTLALSR